MAALNKVLLMGNLTRDPELRYTQSGSAVCEIGMAINRTYMSNNEKKEDVCFVDVNVWGRQAESCSKYLKKGSSLFVEGRLNFDQWNDKETGKSRSKLKVVAERTQFLGGSGRNDNADQNDAYIGNSGANTASQFGAQQSVQNNESFPSPSVEVNQSAFSASPQGGPPPTMPIQAPVAATAPIGNAPVTPPLASQPQEAFNPNMGSEDDIPF